MLQPSGNPFKRHEEVLSLQPMFPPTKRVEFFLPTGNDKKNLDAFIFFFKQVLVNKVVHNITS